MASVRSIGVWIPIDPDRPMPPPESRPMGRAALAARAEGLEVVFGDRWDGACLVGVVAEPGRWRATRAAVGAVQDRFPSQSRAPTWAQLHAGARAAGVAVGNGRAHTLTCRDKLRCQAVLEADGRLRLPPVEADPARFGERLAAWGGGFVKPRFGALGLGVRRVEPGMSVAARCEGVVPGRPDPTFVQWPVPPPAGFAGRVLRVLAQRAVRPDGGTEWAQLPPVLRESSTDPVVNAARGARVLPAEDALSMVVLDDVRRAVAATCQRLETLDTSEAVALELGVDLALDDTLRPWVLEVNSRPRGRLGVLSKVDPDRFGPAHAAAMLRPWRTLAALSRSSATRTGPPPPGRCPPSSPTR